MPEPDVAVIFNLHREGRLIAPILGALDRSLRHAQSAGIRVEVIAVLDNSDAATQQAFTFLRSKGALQSAFEVTQLPVSLGDLGPARNAGIAASRAPYICVLDADNMPSRTWIAEARSELTRSEQPSVIHPERIITFGSKREVWPLLASDSPAFRPGLLAWFNTWDAFVMAPREVFERFPYPSSTPDSGFGPEDWAWNCMTVQAGVQHRIAPGTTLFYDAKPQGSLASAHAGNLLPQNELLRSQSVAAREMSHLTGQMGRVTHSASRFGLRRLEAALRRRSRLADRCARAIRYAVAPLRRSRSSSPPAALDSPPLIAEWRELHELHPALPYPDHETLTSYGVWGENWPELFVPDRLAYWSAIGALPPHIDLLIVVPWMRTGGADLLTEQYIRATRDARPESKIAVITTEPGGSPASSLGDAVSVFDLGEFQLHHHFAVRVLGLLIAQLRPRTLHVINSTVGYDMVDAHGKAISAFTSVFLSTFVVDKLRDGTTWSFLHHRSRDFFTHVTGVLTDNHAFADRLMLEQGVPETSFVVHHQSVDEPFVEREPREFSFERPFRLVWAGRFDRQKRLDRLADLAESAEEAGLPLQIDVYGTPVIDDDPLLNQTLSRLKAAGTRVLGPYSGGFASIRPARYDALILTSDHEGVPNVLLEAMSSGVPIIAPLVGGVREILDQTTGYPVAEKDSTAAYLTALRDVIGDYRQALSRADAARKLTEERYAPEHVSDLLASLPGYLPPADGRQARSSVRWYAASNTVDLLSSDTPLTLIYTGSNGHSNFGDILQTKNIITYWQGRGDRTPVLFLPAHAADEAGRAELLRRWYRCEHIVFFQTENWSRHPHAGTQAFGAPETSAPLHVVGGGYLNEMWGAQHVAAIDEIASAFGCGSILMSGLQIDNAGVEGLQRLAHNHKLSSVGFRDRASLALAEAKLDVPVVDTFDDITETLRDWASSGERHEARKPENAAAHRIAIHMNSSSYAGGRNALTRWREVMEQIARTRPDEILLLSAYADERTDVRDTTRTIADLGEHFPFVDIRLIDIAKAALEYEPGTGLPASLDTLRDVSFAVASSYHTSLFLRLLGVPTYLLSANSYFAQKSDLFALPSIERFLEDPHSFLSPLDEELNVRAGWLRDLDSQFRVDRSAGSR